MRAAETLPVLAIVSADHQSFTPSHSGLCLLNGMLIFAVLQRSKRTHRRQMSKGLVDSARDIERCTCGSFGARLPPADCSVRPRSNDAEGAF